MSVYTYLKITEISGCIYESASRLHLTRHKQSSSLHAYVTPFRILSKFRLRYWAGTNSKSNVLDLRAFLFFILIKSLSKHHFQTHTSAI